LGRGEVLAGIWWGNLSERYHLEYIGLHERIILKWILRTLDRKTWTCLIWLKIGTSFSLLLAR
jgi:hypothetical protein